MNPAATAMQVASRPAARAVLFLAAAAIIALGGCASRQSAPVIERAPGARAPAAPDRPAARAAQAPSGYHVVRRGETLYGIALDHGLDYRELAAWNGITNPSRIRVGDALRMRAPEAPQTDVQVKPVSSAGSVESRPIGTGSEPIPVPQTGGAPAKPDEITIARIEPRDRVPRPEAQPPAAIPEPPPPAPKPEGQADDPDRVDWAWPVSGKVVATFADPGNKGVDIAAGLGDPVHASAPGRVVYSGSGLRGYGKLIIIKHNPTYLSAYAHNNQILVKEGQNVAKGQKIGEVGATDTDAPKLHFEIRRLGKPVDPLKYLPERPS